MTVTFVWARINPAVAPAGPGTSFKEKMDVIGNSVEMVVLLLLIVIGLIVGWFTPTEAGAAGGARR